MAEIKSTMDLVMERAARIGKASKEEIDRENARKQGMQLAVDFMEGKMDGLSSAIADQERNVQVAVRQGAGETILRNIFLPRDDVQQERTRRAVQGLVDLGGGSGNVLAMGKEFENVLAGYRQHREQLQGQLEEQIKMHYDQLMAQQQGTQGSDIKMDPTLQPKLKEEWIRIESELNSQYTKALDQLKEQIQNAIGF